MVYFEDQASNYFQMQPDKRRTIESFFSSNKKPRNEEQQQSDSNTNISLSRSQIQNHPPSSSDHQTSPDLLDMSSSPSVSTSTSLNEDLQTKSIPNDISLSCNDDPVQPKLKSYPLNHQKRCFQFNWFQNRPWLEYSVQNDTAFCFYCRHFSANRLNVGDVFVSSGYNNWKRALENGSGFKKHASSQLHIVASKNYESYKLRRETNTTVIDKLDSGRAQQIRRNRDRLIKICSTVHLLAKQMISFRGHEEQEGYAR